MQNLPLFKGFDPYAMINPKTEHDVIALLNEAISELDNINEHIDNLFSKLDPK